MTILSATAVSVTPGFISHASDKTKIKIDVYDGNKKIESSTTNFLSPRSFD